MNPDTHAEWRFAVSGTLAVEFVEGPLHRQRAAYGPLGVIRLRDGRPEVHHQPVAQVLVQGSAVREERLDHAAVIIVQHRHHLRTREPLAERREVPEVREEERHLAALARSSELAVPLEVLGHLR